MDRVACRVRTERLHGDSKRTSDLITFPCSSPSYNYKSLKLLTKCGNRVRRSCNLFSTTSCGDVRGTRIRELNRVPTMRRRRSNEQQINSRKSQLVNCLRLLPNKRMKQGAPQPDDDDDDDGYGHGG